MHTTTQPYTYAELKELIPFAGIEAISSIFTWLKEEPRLFAPSEYNQLIRDITKRFNELSTEI